MKRTLRIDTRSAVPIWSQIEEGLRHLVAGGALAPGAPVPSVRDLAQELRVNPATVSKAYQRLCDAGVLEVRRGEGTFVAAKPPSLSHAERARVLRDAALRLADLAASLGLARKDAVGELEAAWNELERTPRGARHE